MRFLQTMAIALAFLLETVERMIEAGMATRYVITSKIR
ncbi:hypothetical protein predicted by Glimmer/Critica (plasmid) [Sinorhizobium fredii HH103]|uniref:Uncharacterized protein n=1 Tax=Sinorhizobium fredii (strain HH103) TaxID=1117943 RepID=G9AIU6_SINF1|nr:hypothetical protein predicted by Glimmer/Critica [Sinorhizobium fredii HH103]